MPTANEFIARLPNITAYAVPFDTYFKWSSKDRSGDGTAVTQLVLGVESLKPADKQRQQFTGREFY